MSLSIYFAGSIRAGRDDADLYAKIVKYLKGHGKVLTEHVGNEEMLKKDLEETTDPAGRTKFVHDRDMEWMEETDVLIAEVTQPSLGVGYEIGRAVAMKKPILCLFRPSSNKKLSCMIDGAHDGDKFVVKYYDGSEYEDIIKEFLAKHTK